MAAGYKQQAPMPGWGTATPIADKDLPSWFTKPQGTDAGTHRIYQMMGMSGPDGRIITRNPDGGFTQHAGHQANRPISPSPAAPKQQPVFRNGDTAPDGWTHWKDRNTRGKVGNAATPAPVGNQPAGPTSPMNYQSGINVGGGIGKQGILNGLLDTGNQPNPNVSALARGIAWNDASQIGRAIDAQNQDIRMQQQAKRSESTTEGASNMAKIAGDYAERSISQTNLAAQIAANNIGFAGGIAKQGWNRPENPGAYNG